MDHYQIEPSKYRYINNQQRKGAMENIYNAIYNYCSNDSKAIFIDGDD